jgi:hypothetical protein
VGNHILDSSFERSRIRSKVILDERVESAIEQSVLRDSAVAGQVVGRAADEDVIAVLGHGVTSECGTIITDRRGVPYIGSRVCR